MHFDFDNPSWLVAAIPVAVVLGAVAVWAQRKRTQALRLLAAANAETSEAPRLRWVRQALLIGAAVLACVALARPFDGFRWEEAPRTGSDLLFAIDTSKSMRATDLPPDRLTRAKLAVTDLARQFDGERLGLVAFAGDAFVQAPLTVDRGAFLEAVDALDVDVIPRGGTDLASAIRASVQAMGSEPDRNKVLVLLSDGEDLEGGALEAARDAAKQGLTIFTLGLGSPEGELIETGSGEVVRSKLDEATLRAVAEATGGQYRALGRSGQGAEALYAAVKAKLPHASTAVERHKILDERFQVPLGIALTLLFAEFLIPDRRRRAFRLSHAAVAVVALALPGLAHAETPPGIATYNEGTETYRKGDFEAAQKKFEAALRASDVPVQADAYYDLGNARYRVGEANLEKNRDATITAWKQALEAYDGALALAPKDEDAKFNRDLVARKLAALEQQKKQDEQQQAKNDQQQGGQGQQAKNDQQQGGQGQQQDQQAKNEQQQGGQGQQKDQQAKNDQQQGGQGQQQDQQAKSEQQQGGQGEQANNDQQLQAGQGQHNDEPAKNEQSPQQQASAGEPKDQQQAPDARMNAEPPSSSGQVAQAAEAEPTAQEAQQDAEARARGMLTRAEAKQLLDSVAHDLKPLPIRGRRDARPDRSHVKDW